MNTHSEFFHDLEKMLEARYPILYIETYEYDRVYRNLKSTADRGNYRLYAWNLVDHLRLLSNQDDKYSKVGESIDDPEAILQEISNQMNTPANEIFVLEDFHEHIEDPIVKIWLRKFGEDMKYAKGKKHIVLLTPVRQLPKEIEKYITVLDLPLPDRTGLGKALNSVAADANHDLAPKIRNQLIDAALGMTELEADLAYCLAWAKTKFKAEAQDVVIGEKEQIIKKSGILEFFRQNEDLGNIGGLSQLKSWLDKRGMAFSPAARSFQLSEPKGIMLLGIPGCGKSLTAKAIASRWNMPLLRLDIGKVFEGLVGSSESNIRLAIKTAEAVAPCILWIDEIEKGLAGTGNSGQTDSGVTARVFSTLLTWMQEKNKPVFVVATANGIEHLPPELLRKGRFDGIFFVDLPTRKERSDIFKIHLQKRKQNPERFALDKLAEKSLGFNGAEIEEVINDALFSAFEENPKSPELKMIHLLNAVKSTVILATTMRERIEFLRKWAADRAMPAGEKNDEALPGKTVLAPQERVRNRRLSG